jgi:hypothetical protein
MNLMIDFETLGNRPTTIVVSLGACMFNAEGIHAKELYYFDIQEQVDAGRTFRASTLAWWMKQSDAARQVFWDAERERLNMLDFFNSFELWIDQVLEDHLEGRDELKVWGNGADFDNAILADLYYKMSPNGEDDLPWKFWNGRCFRMFNTMTNIKKKHRMSGAAHNALDDAVYQAECVIKVLQNKKGK